MNFKKFTDGGVAIRIQDIAAVKLEGFKGPNPKLILYVRGIAEPFQIAEGNQQYMKNEYEKLIKQLEEEDH